LNKLSHIQIDSKTIFLLLTVAAITLAGGLFIVKASTGFAFVSIAVVVIGIVSFLSMEIALYLLIISMLLGPQFIVGDATVAAARGRAGITLRVDDFLLIIIGFSWFLKTAIRKELGLFLTTPLNRPIAYYFVVCLISTLFGYMMGRVKGATGFFFVLKYFEFFIVYFMAVNHLKEKKQIERFMFTMLAVCFIVCLIAIYQIPAGGRVSAPFEGPEGEPNTLGGYLVLILSVVLGLMLTWGTKKQKTLLGVLTLLILLSLAATLSRSSWLALVPMAFTLIFFSDKRLPLIMALILIVLISPFILPSSVKERVSFTFTQPKEMGQITVGNVRIDTSTSARVESWKNILERDFINHPILGYGITGYRFVDAQYARVLAETGLMGIVTFLILLYSIYMNALQTYRKTSDSFFRGLSLGYLAGFISMLTHAIGANTFIIVRIMEPFWFLTAMVIIIPTIEQHSQTISQTAHEQ
jgi:O-antigen ligase